MNSIIFTHVAEPVAGVSILDIGLERLGAWLDTERETLGRVFAQAGRWETVSALEALDQLHLGPESSTEDLRELLDHARTCLEVLLEALRAIPGRCALQTAWGLPGPSTFDAHLRWSAARLSDVVAALNHALAA
ncbi:hypothetical protein PVT71_28605 (plasmid) [Salipiger sp. H15]|uniref:Uncharacterized protein n=1 Tax=Alloyangia sp. H15 TaxID=3029062 RepID=A0AAU8ATX9_9RHOB